MRVKCWFAQLPGAGRCEGQLRVCHLIPVQQILNKIRNDRAEYVRGGEPGTRLLIPESMESLYTRDERCWVPGCGGIMGNAGHHGKFKPDGPKPIPRELLPPGLEEFAEELGLTWWLDRTYGERTAA